MASIPLPVSSYRLRSEPASTSRLVNCYPEKLPPDAKTPVILTRAAGIRPFATAGSGAIRGLHKFDGDVFAVVGAGVYRIAADGTVTTVATGIISGSGSVSMAHNTQYMVIVAEPNAYYTDGTTVTQITDPDFTSRGAKYVEFLQNYLVFNEPDSGRVFWADVGSASSFDSLNFVTAEGSPDDVVAIKSDHKQLIVLGEESGEIFDFTADGLVAAINGYMEIGCLNGDTLVQFDNSAAWVANNFSVVRLTGSIPQQISTPAVEQFLSSVDVATLRAYAYNQDGHYFYVLCCSAGCFVFDVVTGEWHERKTYPEDYFRWQFHEYCHGRHYVGDAYSNQIGYFDPTWYKDGDGIQRMEWQYQTIYSQNRITRHDRLEIVMETGVGLTSGQGSNPEVMLAVSDDGGKTFRNLPNKRIGKLGEFGIGVAWSGMGSAKKRVNRCAVSDPVKVAISDTTWFGEGGRA